MAVTRINNNQITDAASGNALVGINANTKLQNYSITSTKLANSLIYGSDLTITGNLTVQGNSTTIDTTVTTIEDPTILLASTQTSGTPTVDIGFVGARGNVSNIAFIWNEANSEFSTVFTSTGESNTTVAITGYANLHTNFANIQGNLSLGGNLSLAGNVTSALNVIGNVTGGNLLTGGLISATGNVTGGNLLTGGLISAGGNITAGNISTAGNVTASNFIGNISGNIDAAGSNTEIQFNDANILAANANFTYNSATNLLTVNGGNVQAGNLLTAGIISATGNATAGNILTAGDIVNASANTLISMGTGSGIVGITSNANTTQFLPSGQINLGGVSQIKGGTFTGSFLTLGTSQTDLAQDRGGNVTVQLGTGGTIANTWTFAQSGALLAPGAVSAVGNVTGGNVLTGGLVSATGNVAGGNLTTGGLVSATGNITTSANIVTNSIVGSNVTITSTGTLDLLPTGNIAVNSKNINNLADPVQDQDAATKIYVDTVAQGLDIKASVVYTTANTLTNLNGAYTYNNGASGVGATITFSGTGAFTPDGTAVSVGQRILVRDEVGAFVNNTTPSAAFNGIYVVTDAGGGTSAVLTRSTDFDNGSPSGEIPGAFTFVEAGSVWADTGWVCTTNNPVTVGTTQIIFTQFSGAGSYTANTSAGISLTGSVFSALVDNNTTAFDVGGNISVKAGANLTTPNIGNATGNSLILSGNGLVQATTVSATGNVIGGNVTTGGIISATGNITGGNVSGTNLTGTDVSVSGNVIGGTISTTGNVIGGNVTTGGIISATGNITGGNVNGTNLTGTTVSVSGNVTGGNVTTSGIISTSGNITGGNILFGSGVVSGTGNIYADTIFANISGNIDAAGSNTEVQFNVDNLLGASAGFTFNTVGNVLTANGNINGANLFTGGLVSATGNVAGGNLTTGGLVSATGNVNANNVIATTIGQFANVQMQGGDITSLDGKLTINAAGGDVDFGVNGVSTANILYIDAGTGTASFGSNVQTTNAIVAFNATTSVLMPTGNTLQRPGTGVTGMLRFNTSTDSLEIYDNSAWTTVGVPSFTVIADEQFAGNGVQTVFTLSTAQTTNSCIVSINGVVQVPTIAYSVSGTTLTFTEAPATADLIDVREITTTTSVTSISNTSGNAEISVSDAAALVNVTGDLSVTGSILGGNINSTAITNGNSNVTVVSSGGNITTSVSGTSNVMVVSSTDVTITGNLTVTGNATLSGNILGDRIQNGTTQIDIQTTGGNANVTVGGTSNVAVFATTGLFVTGVASATGNITGSYIIGNGSQLTGLPAGYANSDVSAFLAAFGSNTISTTGNITSGNLSVGTGTVTVGNIVNSNANGVGNIGSSTTYFNTVFAKATSAQYADLAEKYTADAEYEPGTVVSFGGEDEVTLSTVDADRRVAGVISTNPSYIMNGGLTATHVATVALTGRVPCRVVGTVRKGDLMVSAGDGTARAELNPTVGTVIGKALKNWDGEPGVVGTIEVVVGRF